MNDRFCLDTNILIDFYNKGSHEDRLIRLNFESQLFVSTVVLCEFVRGAHDKTSREIVEGFLKIIQGRILTPTESQWIECARVLEKILAEKKRSRQDILLLQNDLLIAIAARDGHATLITSDKKDFHLINDFVGTNIEYW